MRVPAWAGEFVGTPYEACECWALVRAVLASQAGIDVPAYGDVAAADLAAVARSVRRDAALSPWRQVNKPERLDVVVMTGRESMTDGRSRRAPVHVGIIVSDGLMLHTTERTGAVVERLDNPLIAPRILGFYRHEALA